MNCKYSKLEFNSQVETDPSQNSFVTEFGESGSD